VAAHAHHHLCVRKGVPAGGDGRVVTRFEALVESEARTAEVAAMLGMSPAAAEDLMRAAQAGIV
jgi:DNA repair ATPase RecN